jgi:uncharacterized protein (DUF1697 family)
MIWISMLRGINLGSHNKISMPDLASLYRSFGFSSIQTYLQSGNILFESQIANSEDLSVIIETGIKDTLGFSVRVFLRTPGEIKRIIDNNPFLHGGNIEPSQLHVTFLHRLPDPSDWDTLGPAVREGDEFAIGQQEIFIFCSNGYGRTKLSNSFFERKLDQPATTRNWKTVTALYELVMEKQLPK